MTSEEDLSRFRRRIISLSEITVETVPFAGELIYEDDRPDLTEGMKRRLIVIRQVILKNAGKRKSLARERLAKVVSLLRNDFGLPEKRLKPTLHSGMANKPTIVVRVQSAGSVR